MAAKFSIGARIKSFSYAFKGLWFVFRNEHNFWIHVVAAISVTIAGFYLQVSTQEWLWLVLAMGFVLSAEIFNSAIEKFVDLERPDHDPRAGLIKDMGAAGVLVAAITAAIIGIIIFYPKIF